MLLRYGLLLSAYEQWGYYANYPDTKEITIKFPIAFFKTVFFADVSVDKAGWYDSPSYAISPTLTNLTVKIQTHTDSNLRYIAVGV